MEEELSKKLFGDNFAWGVSTAAFQTEGAHLAEGKGLSIWDAFTAKKGKVLNNQNACTSCDFYNRYREDIDLIKQLNIPNFRFSIAWTRILPNGEGPVNQAGVDYYNRVIDYCLQQGIEPWLTIYHWDLPQALEVQGGWTNRKSVEWFTRFTTVCAEHFGDRVKHWMVMNEPAVFTGAGYFLGLHAPGRTGLKNFLPAIHHVVLSIVAGAMVLRTLSPQATIGTTFSCSDITPRSQRWFDVEAAQRADALINRLYIDPLTGRGYPWNDVPALKGIKKFILPGDEENMTFDFDFIGVQNYTREIVRFSLLTPYVNAKFVKATKRKVPTTLMGWEVYPQAIYNVLKKFNEYPVKQIIVTENGAAFPDLLKDGEINDPERTAYLQSHIEQVLKAKQDGVRVAGYFVWTLTDNFEWAEGYHPRFGLIHIDFDTLMRTVKASGKWYGEFLKG